jgi:radical SAM superfamily enzyme YgiQ (UPF0313 family)
MKNNKVWLLHIPRLNDQLTNGIKEVANIILKNNVDCEILDINHEIYKEYFNTKHWNNIEMFGISDSLEISYLKDTKIEDIIRKSFKNIRKNDVVLLSVFSVESRSWTILTTILLKKVFKNNIKIGLGGSGLRHPGETLLESEWGDEMLERKLCNFIFLGESSRTLKEQIKNNFNLNGKLYNQDNVFPELGFLPLNLDENNKQRIFDSSYKKLTEMGDRIDDDHKKKATIYFTQGCVKQCTFCDVPLMYPNWAMRSAEKVLEEIDYYNKNIGATHFWFPDSTINGSDSEFLKFLRLFDKWQKNKNKISWTSQFAIKPKKQQSKELFDLLSSTGANLIIGFDHCSDDVLDHMKKLYKWEDCEHFISQANNAGFSIDIAMWIVGYPTEEESDYLEYNKLFDLLKSYKKVIKSHIVNTCMIGRNSKLLEYVDIDWKKPIEWTSKINRLDKNARVARKDWLDKKLFELGQNYYKYDTMKIRSKK